MSQSFIFRCHLKTHNRSGPHVLFKNAIKIYRKNPDLFFGPFYRYATQGVASEARRDPLIVPQMVLEYSHWGATFPWRSERQSQPCTFRSCGAESRPSRGAFATRHKPLDRRILPTDRRQLKTCDSRADEISSFQPLLLGSHDEIIMHVHGTSV